MLKISFLAKIDLVPLWVPVEIWPRTPYGRTKWARCKRFSDSWSAWFVWSICLLKLSRLPEIDFVALWALFGKRYHVELRTNQKSSFQAVFRFGIKVAQLVWTNNNIYRLGMFRCLVIEKKGRGLRWYTPYSKGKIVFRIERVIVNLLYIAVFCWYN